MTLAARCEGDPQAGLACPPRVCECIHADVHAVTETGGLRVRATVDLAREHRNNSNNNSNNSNNIGHYHHNRSEKNGNNSNNNNNNNNDNNNGSLPLQPPVSQLDNPLYKTRLCERFETENFCPYGPKCTFAHGAGELRERTVEKYLYLGKIK